ncbi:MAG: hypothetical protein GWO07_13420 [Candidatus Dadabacteria bacterium]|nr:hypothetical protein [Candidatus Dadabacteria bacterium]NIV42980.1 hypothetical protein [Candidatus Dadabacteria bacterium]NIX16187.1 hypothetical protein [Candidatus Dadabacteria bacterium]
MKRLFVYLIICLVSANFLFSDFSTANGGKSPNNSQQGGSSNGQSNNDSLKGSEHSKKGTTNNANKEKHENGQARKKKDQSSEGEKGDERRQRQNDRRGGSQDGNSRTATEKRTERRSKRKQDEKNKSAKKAKKDKVKKADDVMKQSRKGKLSRSEQKKLKNQQRKNKNKNKKKITTGKKPTVPGTGSSLVKKAKKVKRFCKGPLRPLGWCLLIVTLPSEVRAHGVGGTVARNTPLLGEAIEIDECIIEHYDEYRKNKIRERRKINRSQCEKLIKENNLNPGDEKTEDVIISSSQPTDTPNAYTNRYDYKNENVLVQPQVGSNIGMEYTRELQKTALIQKTLKQVLDMMSVQDLIRTLRSGSIHLNRRLITILII